MESYYTINRAYIGGTVVRVDGLKYSKNGTQILQFAVVTKKAYQSKDEKSYEYRPTFHNIVCYGKKADYLSKIIEKGMFVLVEGSISIDKYTDANGNQRTSIHIDADKVVVPDTKDQQPADTIDDLPF